MSDVFYDGVMPYRKKSVKKRRKKSKHAHKYAPCVFEYEDMCFDKAHGIQMVPRTSIGSYCVICGKVGDVVSASFVKKTEVLTGFTQDMDKILCVNSYDYTDEGKRELDPETRTMPTFHIDLYKDRYVDMSQDIEEGGVENRQ